MRIRSLIRPPSVKGSVVVPGSKSYTNRALVTAALAKGRSILQAASPSSDSEAMILALRSLGVTIESNASSALGSTLQVAGVGRDLLPFQGEIDVGPAGTTMRFLTAVCSAIPGADITIRGSERMHQRPIHPLVDALRQLGAEIEYLGVAGCPPLRIRSTRPLQGGVTTIDGSVSSQFISALLLVSPMCAAPITVKVLGEQISQSYIDMTLQSIEDFGVNIQNNHYREYYCAGDQSYLPRVYLIEGDASGASYLWGMAAVSQGEVRVENLNPLSAQGDIGFPELLSQMGCIVTKEKRAITVRGPAKLTGIHADMTRMPDTAQTLATIAACAAGETTITGLITLRVKETDRISALHTELNKMRIDTATGPESITIKGGSPHGAQISTYEDHRMAMSFALLAARIEGIRIEHPEVVEKSFSDFWGTLKTLGVSSVLEDTNE